MFVETYPELRQYICVNRKLVFKLQKYLYGLPQAAFHFHQYLSQRMQELGFIQLTYDRYLWRTGSGDMCIYVCAHVNGLMAIGKPEALVQFESEIKRVYDITVQRGFKHTYIGLDITQSRHNKSIIMSQKGFHKELINKYSDEIKGARSYKVPCDTAITQDPTEGSDIFI
jgi:hypothetical protein